MTSVQEIGWDEQGHYSVTDTATLPRLYMYVWSVGRQYARPKRERREVARAGGVIGPAEGALQALLLVYKESRMSFRKLWAIKG